jgi:hypothetical protein
MTKKDEKNTSEKEVYRLWWEYLKRSEKYKIFCDFIREASKIKIKKEKTVQSAASNKPIKPTFILNLNEVEFYYMQRYYKNFGDIFTNSFDDWWKTDKPSQPKLPVIVLNDPNACKALPFFAKEFRKQQKAKKKSLSPEKTLKILAESEFEFIFLAVPMVGGITMEDISKQIANIRKKWAKNFDVEDFYFKRFNMPVSRVRFVELKRYLEVFDLKQQGLKMKEIIAKIDSDRKGGDADILRSFRSYLQKAKKVIYNVECGSFPEAPQF